MKDDEILWVFQWVVFQYGDYKRNRNHCKPYFQRFIPPIEHIGRMFHVCGLFLLCELEHVRLVHVFGPAHLKEDLFDLLLLLPLDNPPCNYFSDMFLLDQWDGYFDLFLDLPLCFLT